MRWAWVEVKSVKIVALISVLICVALPTQAQDDVVRVKANLVNIDVIVKDKKGKYVSDLKPEDFAITENGVTQKIEFFDAPLSRPDAAKPGEQVASTAPRNYVSLVLDFQTTDVTNLKQVREGAIKYVREQMTDADAVAVLTVTNGLQMLQPFTHDKAKLIACLEKLGSSADSKNFEQRDVAENIANLRDFLNGAETAIGGATTTPAAARVMIAQRVLQQFIKMRTALSFQ